MGPFKYGWVCAPEGAAHPLILDGLCLHVLSSFQRTEPCIALPCFRSATFQIYDSSYIAVNPKNRPVARFFTPLSSPKPVKRRRIRHRGSSRLQDRSGSGRPGTCCAGPEATLTCHVDRRDSLRTSKNITRSRPCQILHRFEALPRKYEQILLFWALGSFLGQAYQAVSPSMMPKAISMKNTDKIAIPSHKTTP